jgi:hypothetical protein
MADDDDFPGLVANAKEMEGSEIAHPQNILSNIASLAVFPVVTMVASRLSNVVHREPSREPVERSHSVRGDAINHPARPQRQVQ